MNDFSNVEVLEIDEKKNNKKALIVLIFILIMLFGIGLFFFLRYARNNSKDIKLENKVIELGNQIDKKTKNYLKSKCKLDFSKVDLNKVGKYKYYAKCDKKTYEATIEIKDTTSPNVVLKVVNITPKKAFSVNDFISEVSDLSKVDVSFEKKLNDSYESGLYLIGVVASDEYNNKTTTKGILLVSSIESTNFLTATKDSKTSYDASLKITDKIGFNSANYYNNSYRIYEYAFNSKEEYNKALQEYEEKNMIENINGEIIKDDKNLTVKLFKYITREELNKLNGSFPYTYNEVSSLYSSLKYTVTN